MPKDDASRCPFTVHRLYTTENYGSKKAIFQLDGYEKMMYDDAYTILLQPSEVVETYNYVAGMVPFLQKLLTEVLC